VSRPRARWAHAPHRLGGPALALAPGALPGHDVGAAPAPPAGLPSRSALDAGADRGLPSAGLLAQGRQGGTDVSVRLRWSAGGTVDRGSAMGVEHGEAGRLRGGQRTAAMLGRGGPTQPRGPGWVVGSAAVAALPQQKQNPGTLRERAQRATVQAQPRAHQQGRKTQPPSAVVQRDAQPWGLLSPAATVAQAVAEDAGRRSIAATYRDWPPHWAVRAAVVALPTAAMVARLIGLVCLAYAGQRPLGQRVRAAPLGQRRRAQWTVTKRVSWGWGGHQLCADPGYAWRGGRAQQWESLGWRGATASGTSVSEPALAEAA